MARATEIKALFFDVFGTLVDWRGGVASQAEASLAPLGFALDWLAFAMPGAESIKPAWKKSAPAAFPSLASTFCIAAISTAFFRDLPSKAFPNLSCTTSISPGTGSMPGRTQRRDWRGFVRVFF